VERRKIRSGSSAANTWEAGHSIDASASHIQRLHLVSHRLRNLRVIDISVGEAANHVAAGKPRRKAAGSARRPLFNFDV
jgi:hypothetical protein